MNAIAEAAAPKAAGKTKAVPVFHAGVAFEHRTNPSGALVFMVYAALTMLLRL